MNQRFIRIINYITLRYIILYYIVLYCFVIELLCIIYYNITLYKNIMCFAFAYDQWVNSFKLYSNIQ